MLPMFYLEQTTSLRKGELVALLWSDLDLENQTLTVSKSAGRINGEVKVTQPKTANSVRTICLPKETGGPAGAGTRQAPREPVYVPLAGDGEDVRPGLRGEAAQNSAEKGREHGKPQIP